MAWKKIDSSGCDYVTVNNGEGGVDMFRAVLQLTSESLHLDWASLEWF